MSQPDGQALMLQSLPAVESSPELLSKEKARTVALPRIFPVLRWTMLHSIEPAACDPLPRLKGEASVRHEQWLVDLELIPRSLQEFEVDGPGSIRPSGVCFPGPLLMPMRLTFDPIPVLKSISAGSYAT
jgi:hypothetical protein